MMQNTHSNMPHTESLYRHAVAGNQAIQWLAEERGTVAHTERSALLVYRSKKHWTSVVVLMDRIRD